MTPTYFIILMLSFGGVCAAGLWLYDGYKQDQERDKNKRGWMTSKLKSATELITEDLGNIYKILDKLEQRIATLEKVLASHAKTIGQLRGDKPF